MPTNLQRRSHQGARGGMREAVRIIIIIIIIIIILIISKTFITHGL